MNLHEFRSEGHKIVDWIADYLNDVENKILFPSISPSDLKELFKDNLPDEELPPNELWAELENKLFPHCCQVNHPGYFGLITSTPTPTGILGDFISSAINQNVGGYVIGPGAVEMERQTVRWLADLIGYGENAGGNLTSGGTMANFEAMKLARDAISGNTAQYSGVGAKWGVYVSEERHVSIDKAVDVIGIGRSALHTIPTDEKFRISINLLEEAIAKDKEDGIKVMCIIGLAGTTNTGAVDDLASLRAIADRERAWMHVDAAYGGGVLMSGKFAHLLDGVSLADSITIDPHKWFFFFFDAGAVLYKDKSQLQMSYGMRPAYLDDESDIKGERFNYYEHSFEQSRRFRGLKVWMSFKRYGRRQIGEWVERNIQQAQFLYKLCEKYPDFVPASYPSMSAVCIRFDPGSINEKSLIQLHANVARKIEQNGNYWISTTRLKGKSYFRINPVNFRTRMEHMQGLMEEIALECRSQAEQFFGQ